MSKFLTVEARQEWRAYWKLVFASATGATMMAIALGSLGVFMIPLEETFGWKRAEVSAGLAMYAVAGVIFAPLLGGMLDRWGPRRFAVPGVLICGATFALFGLTTGSSALWIGLWLLYSIAAQIPAPLTWSAAISREFTASRGAALAVVYIGGALGSALTPVIANALIDAFGWRLAYGVMGLSWGGVVCVVCYFFFHSRADQGGAAPGARTLTVKGSGGATTREILTSSRFIRLAMGVLIGNTLSMGIYVHQIPMLINTGLSRSDATWLVGIAGVAAISGKVISGSLADRVPGNRLSAAFVILPLLSYSMFIFPADTIAARFIPVLALGMNSGAVPHLLSYITSRYFGVENYGKVFGIVVSVMAVAMGSGPVLAGYVYDQAHNYTPFLMTALPLVVLAAALYLSLGRYPDDTAEVVRHRSEERPALT